MFQVSKNLGQFESNVSINKFNYYDKAIQLNRLFYVHPMVHTPFLLFLLRSLREDRTYSNKLELHSLYNQRINEEIDVKSLFVENVKRLSLYKAEKYCGENKCGIIIGSDTIVVINQSVLGNNFS